MKITIISGGSGNDALVKGLTKLYPNIEATVITNCYDNGKSTGVCRFITDTLGVSDVRKNHSRMYEATCDCPDKRLLEFYNKRFDIPEGKELSFVKSYLDKWGLQKLEKYAESFFARRNYFDGYKDFSIANIIYSEMYSELGYEATNKYFCNLLGLNDFVLLNSFDNAYINAITEHHSIIKDEGDIVAWNNPNDKILDTFYTGNARGILNQKAIDAVMNCDLILISTGTFWSSIYPTLQYGGFYHFINDSKAKKIWAINCEEDKDAKGVSSTDFINYVKKLGLNLDDFSILQNDDACDMLKKPYKGLNIVKSPMGNNNGKHDGQKFASEILKIYYGLNEHYDTVLFDFDDTIWSRDNNLRKVSVDNLKLISNLKEEVQIVSGNTFESIKPKLYSVLGTSLEGCPQVWADANSVLYNKGVPASCLRKHAIPYDDIELTKRILGDKSLSYETYGIEGNVFNIKVKPLSELERKLLCDVLNDYLVKCIAVPTGLTTVDIVSIDNTKASVYNYLKLSNKKTLYIGDEVDDGNDKEISSLCTNSIHTSGAEETNTLIRLLEDR